ncbi:MAG: hypothetical protein JW395_1255 [Nitrospira sp.]|nr:hypothetical protein [Nitrospira sp.]
MSGLKRAGSTRRKRISLGERREPTPARDGPIEPCRCGAGNGPEWHSRQALVARSSTMRRPLSGLARRAVRGVLRVGLAVRAHGAERTQAASRRPSVDPRRFWPGPVCWVWFGTECVMATRASAWCQSNPQPPRATAVVADPQERISNHAVGGTNVPSVR